MCRCIYRPPCFCHPASQEDVWEPCSDPAPKVLTVAEEPALDQPTPSSHPLTPCLSPSASSLLGPQRKLSSHNCLVGCNPG